MPRKTAGKAGRIDQSRDSFVIKVNREDVKLEISVLNKSPLPFTFTKIRLGRPKRETKTCFVVCFVFVFCCCFVLFFFLGGGA